MGKPRDLAHAATMLHRLSGRKHQVWTATAVVERHLAHVVRVGRRLRFRPYTRPTGGPADFGFVERKAGGYDLAGPMGEYARLVEGDTSTVLGLAGGAMAFLESLASLD